MVNVAFHTLAALGTAAVLSSCRSDRIPQQFAIRDSPVFLGIAFAAGILEHGLLDYAPHWYTVKSEIDIFLSLILVAIVITLARPQHRPLVGVCFLGSIFPNLVDLGPPILNRNLGWSLPVVKIFS